MDASHDLISPTAKLVAALRAKSGIPYCREIAELCNASEITHELFKSPEFVKYRKPMVEMRFKALNVLLKRFSGKQILEIASGVSPRGLIMTEDPNTVFVEMDLPEMMQEKRRIVRSLINLEERTNYALVEGNALCENDIWDAYIMNMRPEPLTIAHEGFVPYLFPYEREPFTASVCRMLSCFSGYYITTDVMIKERFERMVTFDPGTEAAHQRITEMTGRDLKANSHESWTVAECFYRDMGFSVQRFKQMDLVPEVLAGLDVDKYRFELEEVWVMTVT
jgi:O-methyltransferase involved in polyketide biosynthesis